MNKKYFAHTMPGETATDAWETLAQHEQQVALRCSEFLARIDPQLAPWGDILGRWHDIGKYSLAFWE